MKEFIKNVFSSALGFFLALGLICLIGIIFLIGSIASTSSKPTIKSNSVLYIPLSGIMQEQAVDDPLSQLMGNQDGSLALNQACQAIKAAKGMSAIKGIYLEAGMMQSDPASLEELRKYLLDFKKSGKFVLSYGETYTQGGYYVCSVADKIMLNPVGEVDWKGLSTQPMFFKDMLQKFGVKMQVFKVGTFKSAVEPFTNTEMSEANRKQVTEYLGSIWNNFVAGVSASRKIPVDSLKSYADQFMGFAPAQDLVKKHMVDTLAYIDDAKSVLKRYVGIDEDDKLNLVSPSELTAYTKDDVSTTTSNQVAVYYAAGDIVDEDVQGYTNQSLICAPKVVKDMASLADNEDVKAVVLRINSGGGSANASEQIWHAIKELSKQKPVVVSMGGMAASGAYYMSSASQYIFAEPTTLTGSIGIFGIIPDVSGLLKDKLGLKFDGVKTNKMSDFGNISRPFNEEEKALLQHRIERGYNLFVNRVAGGRKMKQAQVDSIGQGRVWTGEQAIKIGLVDRLGTLEDAIAYAAKLVNMGDKYTPVEYPVAQPWYISLINQEKDSYYESRMRAMLGIYYEPLKWLKTVTRQSVIQARLPYSPNIY